jgi:hypothetical protein
LQVQATQTSGRQLLPIGFSFRPGKVDQNEEEHGEASGPHDIGHQFDAGSRPSYTGA